MPRTKSFDQREILDKATDLFWLQGYGATPPQDILDDTGLSRSSLYDTYGDKHSLFLQSLRRYRDRETAAAIRFLDESEDATLAIRQIFQHAYEVLVNMQQQKGCLMINTLHELVPHDPEVAALVFENRQALEDAYTRAVRRGQQQGGISNTHQPRALARYLLNSLWGLTVHLKLGIAKRTADDIVKITLSVL
jgi:TetR/AcrR family transcriptional repressor of nem operon